MGPGPNKTRRSLIHVKASSIDRRLAKTALEARLGTFVAADCEQGSEKQEYQKRPRFNRVDTSRLWEEYQAQRELHKTLRQAKLVSLATSRALQFDGAKAAARAKRSVIKMTLKGAGRRIAYAAVQNELRQGIRAVNARIREERRALGRDTQQLSWVDWLQRQSSSGRSDALEALTKDEITLSEVSASGCEYEYATGQPPRLRTKIDIQSHSEMITAVTDTADGLPVPNATGPFSLTAGTPNLSHDRSFLGAGRFFDSLKEVQAFCPGHAQALFRLGNGYQKKMHPGPSTARLWEILYANPNRLNR